MSTAPTGQWADADVEVRVQPYRSLDDLALPTESTLLEILAELRKLNTRPPTESRSSVEIDSNGSAGKIKIKIKTYADSTDEARQQAMVEFVQAMADIELAQEAGWQAMAHTP